MLGVIGGLVGMETKGQAGMYYVGRRAVGTVCRLQTKWTCCQEIMSSYSLYTRWELMLEATWTGSLGARWTDSLGAR